MNGPMTVKKLKYNAVGYGVCEHMTLLFSIQREVNEIAILSNSEIKAVFCNQLTPFSSSL